MSESKLGIRIYNPVFTGELQKLECAARAFFQSPVSLRLPIVLMDANDPTYARTVDEINVTIVNVTHNSDDKNIVVLHVRIVEGSKKIKKVAVMSEGNADAEEEVLHNGDSLTIIADVANGDAVITLCSGEDRDVYFDDMTNILPRLAVPDGLPNSEGEPIEWEDFDPQENA